MTRGGWPPRSSGSTSARAAAADGRRSPEPPDAGGPSSPARSTRRSVAVSGSDRDLVLALRSELAAIDPARPCDRAAEASALLLGRRRGPAGDPPLARLVVRLAREREPETPDAATAFDWDRAAEHCRVAWL